ncbi:tetratricopeptide repeat protein [Neomegalonema sp.]|uniref:tetratricopeptide repeat protein n=1 Tax=Neomegalonema sp. TaxID=2039713 RepID=UPI002622FB4C|nr:tetratricopeptide repeat protein [Neomegalonema sp.]MDD2867357.1 tetratricopeptide repeat protein [Neomegalonema sp.]
MRLRFLLLALLAVPAVPLRAEEAPPPDDARAYRLLLEGRPAEAAALFGDPAWKAVAHYRAGEHWRAAEIFAGLPGADAAYNLGNAYARLESLQLALEAYERALKLKPDFEDAAFNAELVRAALEERDRYDPLTLDKQAREMEQMEDRGQRSAEEARGEGEKAEDAEERAGGETQAGSEDPGEAAQRGGSEETASGEEGGERGEESGQHAERGEESQGGGEGAKAGEASEASSEEELDNQTLRQKLEAQQATEQWLQRITDDPAQFLAARIAREFRRRKAVGEAPPDSEDPW